MRWNQQRKMGYGWANVRRVSGPLREGSDAESREVEHRDHQRDLDAEHQEMQQEYNTQQNHRLLRASREPGDGEGVIPSSRGCFHRVLYRVPGTGRRGVAAWLREW